jgi:hypothetical protein
MNGAQGAPGVTPATPRIEVRTGADGSVSLWYNVGGEWTNTGVNIKGPQGGSGTPGTPGAAGVSPIVRVVDNGNGTITIQYNATAGYPAGGWTAAGDPISLGGNPRDKEAIFSIVEDDATGTITITLNDSDTPAERTVFEFAKASGAVRMEIVGFNDRTVIAEGRTAEIRFRVNPSDAWVPTGEGEAIAGKRQLDQTGTHAGYVNAPTDFELASVATASPDPTKDGEYIATIKCVTHNPSIIDYAMALVLNTGTDEKPSLVSSPTFVLGAEAPVAWGQAGDDIRWAFWADGTLIFDGTGEMWDFGNDGGSPWYEHRSSIETVVIPDGVTTIGDNAFDRCGNLTEITIPESVTSIGGRAFHYCTALTEIAIPDNVETIGHGAFYRCWNLKEITIGDGVKTIGSQAFAFCWALTDVTIGDGVETIEREAFYSCTALTEITLPASVTTIGTNAFGYCSKLTEIVIPDGVTTIEPSTFQSCGKLTKATIGAGVTSIGDKAFNRSALTEITIPDGVTTIGKEIFDYCRALANVTLGAGVTSIGEKAFNYCDVLAEINIPASVTTIGASAFASTALTEIAIPASVTTLGASAFRSCSKLTEVTIGDGVTAIEPNTFDSCRALTSATIGAGVTSIGASAFNYCPLLANVTCLAVAPPTLANGNFNYNNADELRVPNGSVDAYKGVSAWSTYFKSIVAIP